MVFYTYLWLREDGTPYYVGKGKGDRGFISKGHSVRCPKDSARLIVQEHPSETDAFAAEEFLIAYYGRKDVGTGCLLNRTDGRGGDRRTHTLRWNYEEAQRILDRVYTSNPEEPFSTVVELLQHKFDLNRSEAEDTVAMFLRGEDFTYCDWSIAGREWKEKIRELYGSSWDYRRDGRIYATHIARKRKALLAVNAPVQRAAAA
jgi:hypothetical protein